MRAIALLSLLALAGCGTIAKVKAVAPIAVGVAERGIDAKAKRSRNFLCNRLSYRAEMKLRKDSGIAIPAWNGFCRRLVGIGRE